MYGVDLRLSLHRLFHLAQRMDIVAAAMARIRVTGPETGAVIVLDPGMPDSVMKGVLHLNRHAASCFATLFPLISHLTRTCTYIHTPLTLFSLSHTEIASILPIHIQSFAIICLLLLRLAFLHLLYFLLSGRPFVFCCISRDP